MLNIFSLLDKIFIQIISNPIITAPRRQRTATGSTFKSKVGLININPPKNEISAANQRITPTLSLKSNTAKIIAKIGLRNVRAVASLIGI